MLAVGGYSGPRAVRGAVAQLAKNARHVTAAIRRMDTLAFSSLIKVGRVQAVGDDSEELFCAHLLLRVRLRATYRRQNRRQIHEAVEKAPGDFGMRSTVRLSQSIPVLQILGIS